MVCQSGSAATTTASHMFQSPSVVQEIMATEVQTLNQFGFGLEELKSEAQRLRKDDSYESALVQPDARWQDIYLCLDSRAKKGSCESSEDNAEFLEALLHFIAMTCRRSSICQDLAVEAVLFQPIVLLFLAQHEDASLSRRCMIALSNMVTSNANAAGIVLPYVFQHVPVQQAFEARHSLVPFLVFIRNAIHVKHELTDVLITQDSFLPSVLMLLPSGAYDTADETTLAELVSVITYTFIKRHTLHKVMKHFSSQAESATIILVLWRFIENGCFHEQFPTVPDSRLPSEIAILLKQDVDKLENILTSETDQERSLSPQWQLLMLQVASLAAILSNQQQEHCRTDITIQAVIEPVITLLGLACEQFPRGPGGRASKEEKAVDIHHLKRDCVRIVTCLAHRNKDIQDKVRMLGGLGLVLAQCNIDEDNPYIKEHATLCMRTLLENNRENQAEVENMTPLSTEQTPQLAEAGMQSRLNANGKVELLKSQLEEEKPDP